MKPISKAFVVLAATFFGLSISSHVVFADVSKSNVLDGSTLFVGPSLGLVGGSVGFGGSIGLDFRVLPEHPYFLGMSSGLQIWVAGGVTAFMIPILVSNRYEFSLAHSAIRPYIGIDIGAAIVTASFGGASGSGAAFEMLLRPGFRISSFFFEPRFGTLGSAFLFQPTAGLVFSL